MSSTVYNAARDCRRTNGVPMSRLLVVDDLHDAADSLALVLRLTGHEARTA